MVDVHPSAPALIVSFDVQSIRWCVLIPQTMRWSSETLTMKHHRAHECHISPTSSFLSIHVPVFMNGNWPYKSLGFEASQ